MIANILSRRLAQNQLLLKYYFARKVSAPKRHVQSQPIQQDQILTQSQTSKLKWQQKRQQNIFRGSQRVMRQEEEDLQKEIIRLMNANKTDQQIIKELARKNQPQHQQQQQYIDDPIAQDRQSFLQKQFGFTNNVQIKKIQYNQQAMIQHIKKQSQRQAIERGKQVKKRKTEEEQNINTIPDEFLKSVEQFKNTQLNYLNNIVRKQQKGKNMKQRKQKGYIRGAKQLVIKQQEVIKPQTSDIVAVQQLSTKIQRMSDNYKQTLLSQKDQDFIKKGELDLQRSQINSELYLREDQTKLMKKFKPKTSHTVQQIRIDSFQSMLQKHKMSMSLQQIKQIEKQTLMQSKNNLEQLQLFRKRLQRRQRIKKIKQIAKKMTNDQFSDNYQTKQIYKPLDFNLKKHKISFDMINHDKVNEINKNYARSMFSAESRKVDHLDMRTDHNMKQWLWYQFIDGQSNRISHAFDKIVIQDIYINDSNTTITIWWRTGSKIKQETKLLSQQDLQQKQRQIDHLENILQKSGTYLSGKMCQDLNLRFGPLIIFKYKQKNIQQVKAQQQMLNQMPIVIRQKIKQQVKKGNIPPKIKQQKLNQIITSMQDAYEQKIKNINFKTANQKQQKQKRERTNRNQDGSRKKKKSKSNPADQFWNGL